MANRPRVNPVLKPELEQTQIDGEISWDQAHERAVVGLLTWRSAFRTHNGFLRVKRSMPEVFGLSVPKGHGRKVNFRTQFFMVVGYEISERVVVRNTKAMSEAKGIETVAIAIRMTNFGP